MKIFIGAGEASGDLLGSRLITELKSRYPVCHIMGIGGPLMERAGLKSFLPMEDLSLIGIFEVLPKLPKLLMHLWRTKRFILKQKPDVIITIDAPDFYLRLLKQVKKKCAIPTIHYNAPAVWASRPKRAKKIACFVDHLLCLFPFEPSYFAQENMKATFVGHPLTELHDTKSAALPLPDSATIVTVLFGSRPQEIKRLRDPFIESCVLLKKDIPNLYLLIPTFDTYKAVLQQKLELSGIPYSFVDQEQKHLAFKMSKAALAASGTVAIELAQAAVPFVVGYKLSPLTYILAKRLIITPYVCLINILLKEPLIPECLQDNCTPRKLFHELSKILTAEKKTLQNIKNTLGKAYTMLRPHQGTPSQMACDVIINCLKSCLKS